jgi:hypothetical protein
MSDTPGSDLLNDALDVVNPQALQYYRFLSRELNDVGQYISSFEDPVAVYGSMQPVPKTKYEAYGLDLTKSYFTLYLSANTVGIVRGSSGDQFGYNNQRFQIESNTDWHPADGWQGILMVQVDA